MAYGVRSTDEFDLWWQSLSDAEQDSVARVVRLLEDRGPTLPFPYSSGVVGSKFSQMRELRIQHRGKPYRVIYAFDPQRAAVLLIGGDKTGDRSWYDDNVRKADRLFRAHLESLEKEIKRG